MVPASRGKQATTRALSYVEESMGTREGKKERVLEVRLVFEPNRLAHEYLADAYERVLPVLRRPMHSAVSEKAMAGCEDKRLAGRAGA
jgi:hypothetical protein